jgi:hypothetical protein
LVDLNVDFYNNGQLDDPFWIKKIEIYKCSVAPHNLQSVIILPEPTAENYPLPICQEKLVVNLDECSTGGDTTETPVVGKYHLPFLVPHDFKSPEVYLDVWYYHPINPCHIDLYPAQCPPDLDLVEFTDGGCDHTDPVFDGYLKTCCHRFWVYPDSWMCDDGLQTVEFGYEPKSVRFNYPERRNLEIGLIPMPLYNFNRSLFESLVPFVNASITIGTQHHEFIVRDSKMELGFKQGHYSSNPWVLKYMVDTSKFLKGSYWYQVKLELPDGSSRVSNKFWIEIR